MTLDQAEEFRWAYSVARVDIPNAPPIQLFDRIDKAKLFLAHVGEAYPEIPFGVFARGDQLYMGHPEFHETTH